MIEYRVFVMVGGLFFCVVGLAFASHPLAAPGITSLTDSRVRFHTAEDHHVVLQRGDVRAIVVDNAALNRPELPGHRAGYNGLASLTHRLDDYLADITELEDDHIADLQAFGDRISALLDGESVALDQVPDVVRELPTKKSFDVTDIEITDTEVTVVMPQRSAARVVERELQACGYRVSTVLNPFEAIELIIEQKPDMVITAMVMPTLSGVDLACALAAMPATRGIAVAVLTSLDRNHPDLKQLPVKTGLIRRGDDFGDDLADVLQRFGIT